MKLTISIIMLIVIASANAAQPKSTKNANSMEPDFAFPQQATKQAEKNLDEALKKSDGKMIVRSFIDIALAQGAIGNEKIQPVYKRIQETIASEKDPVTKSLLNLLAARICSDAYNQNRWKYDERQLPLDPLPDDWTEWSGKQFHNEIMRMLDDAVSSADALKAIPLKEYSSLITHNDQTFIYYPTLFDFAGYQYINILNSINYRQDCLSVRLLVDAPDFIRSSRYVSNNANAKKILDMYALLLEYNSQHYAPEIHYNLERLEYTVSKIYNSQYDDATALYRKLLDQLYNKYYGKTEYSGEILIKLLNTTTGNTSHNKTELYGMIKDFINRYPSFWKINSLKNKLEQFEQPSLSVSFDAVTAPGKSMKFRINADNILSAKLKIYRIPDKLAPDNNFTKVSPDQCILIGEYPVTFTGCVPFSAYTYVMVTLQDYGVYYPIIESERTQKAYSNNNYNCFRVTDILGSSISFDKAILISTDIISGQPVPDVEFTAKYSTYNDKRSTHLGKSDSNGILNIVKSPWPDNNYLNIYPTKGSDRWSQSFNTWLSAANNKSRQISFSLFTDLPVYHPGDTIDWSAVVYINEYDGSSPRPAKDRLIKAIWKNANYQPIDTVFLTTDKYGRINGRFTATKGELTGNYSITLSLNDETENENGRTRQFYVMVSDYKMPTFFITMDNPMMNAPTKNAVTLRGKVTAYSGVSLANTTVRLNLSAGSQYYWRNNNLTEFFADSTTTDSKGNFKFELPADLLDNSPAPDGQYMAEISATSPSGESQQQTQRFMRGNTYILSATLTENKKSANVSSPVGISVTVTDASQKKQNLPVRLSITHNEDTVLIKKIMPETTSIDLSALPTGSYDMTFCLDGESSNTVTLEDIAIYRTNDSKSPSEDPLWIDIDNMEISLQQGQSKQILYAVPTDASHILYAVCTNEKINDLRWIKCDAGIHPLEISIPHGHDKAFVILSSSRNYKTTTKIITLKKTDPANELKLISETFRNNIVPDSYETWTFRTVDGNGVPNQSAIIMGMSNYALNAINNKTWPQSLDLNYFSQSPNFIKTNFGFNCWQAKFNARRKSLTIPTLIDPAFNTYGLSFFNTIRHIRGSIMMKSASNLKSEASLDEVTVAGYGTKVYDAVEQPSPVSGLDGMIPGISIAEDQEAENEDSGDGSATPPVPVSGTKRQGQSDFAYRDGLSAIAFFKPTLQTDKEGRLTMSFHVPNANTTWLLQGLAYNDKLASASLNQLIIANKPVMVTPNLPRFVRTNDIVDLSALVLNNSDSIQQIKTTIEIFNPINNTVICSSDTISEISPRQSATASIRFSVPSDLSAIGYRVKSSTKYFADGEQNIISVLPVTTPVIETVPFYISPDSTDFAMTLPRIGSEASVTLDYCDNPLWYVVTALPGLRNSDITTAQSAADAIFSAAVADGLLRDNPTIAEALRQWTASDRSDSTLVSMLQRNSDLKTMLLQATPWVVDAMSDTERMQRLALLFDPQEIKSVYTRSISTLDKLQRPEGGWAWMEQTDSPSEWATEQTLYILGCLNRLGYLPSDKKLNAMIVSALAWHQKETEKEFRRYPEQSFYSFLQLRDLWPTIKPSQTGKTIIRREIQRIVKDWKSFDIANKSACAMLLDHNGYRQLAHTVLQSVSEYAESSPTKGMWWPSAGDSYAGQLIQLRIATTALMAYSQLMPESDNIDMIRQWLILQKQTQNWGQGSMPSEIITALLTSSRSWIQPAGNVDILIGKSKVKANYEDSYLGNLRMDISQLNPSEAQLEISRTSHTPAWGAVFSRSEMKMTEVKSSSCEDLSIEKRIYRQNGTEWEDANELRVGDRVKVQLLIHVGRDMQYVAITDDRSACLEPIEQLPRPIYSEGICFYRENRDSATNIFVTNLPRGTYMLSYELWVNNSGIFSSGIATAQSQYAPSLSAHSAGKILTVNPK